ncbi:MAG: hypothetical protein K0R39_2370 [Symbiobacteriaceae bacterium]|jgi:prepilin-type N-terminal cleavage/methylation domain-containing protein|nr:hypothetical protein [Symbiobacteriaceae bacterium]
MRPIGRSVKRGDHVTPWAARFRRGSRDGFTLAELLVVCAIIGILLLLAVPRYSALAESVRLRNTAYQFISDTRYAQELAQQDWTRSRLLFGSDFYEVQVGTTSNPAADCLTTTGYSVVKRERLIGIVEQRSIWAGSCLVFERTGRISFAAPQFSEVPRTLSATELAMLLDGEAYEPADDFQNHDAVWWDGPSTELEVDLGQTMWVGSVCAGVVRTPGRIVEWPTLVEVASATSLLGTFPVPGDPSIRSAVPTGSDLRTCPALDVNSNARYLRFRFTNSTGVWGDEGVLVDEIEIFPTVTFTSPSGRYSRTAKISPVTGSVTLTNN